MSRLSHFREMLSQARRLNLNPAGTLQLLGSYYLHRAHERFGNGKLPVSLIDVELNGRRLRVPVRSNGIDHKIFAEIFADKAYDQGERHFDTILDLGANTGLATLFFSARYPNAQLACVEPSPQNIPILEQAITVNSVHASVFKAAVGLESGTATFYVSDDPTCSSLLPREGLTQALTVPVISLPELIQQLGWESISLLKIDIEGYEKHLFSSRPEWLRRVDLITGEIHVGYTFKQLESDLGCFGFKTTQISENPEYGMVVFSAERAP